MGFVAYPTDVTMVSSDIELVGGKNASEWMIREDNNGNRYLLVKLDSDCDSGNGVGIPSGLTITTQINTSHMPIGFNTTGKNASSGDYIWIQTYGLATVVTDGDVQKYDYIGITNGVAVDITPGSTGNYRIGWAVAADVGTSGRIFICRHGGA